MAEDVFGLVGTVQAGTFRIEAAVAEGGFGVVYRAHHTAFRAPVALKCLKIPGTLSADDRRSFEEQFRAEAELLFQLSASTPTVVRPLQVGVITSRAADFVPFMALEWLNGQSLDALIQDRSAHGEPPLTIAEALQLLRPVAYALDNAHRFPGRDGAVCILHRDMKPENVFIANVHGQKAVRILDFGIAKVKSAATAVVGKASAEADSLSAFTPAYAAPEQWLPKRFGQTGPWTDVYGLALTVVETVCGRPAVEGDHAAMLGAALDEQVRPTPRALGIAVPEEVDAVLAQALAVDPKNRFKRIGAFWSALTAAVEGSMRPPAKTAREGRQIPPPFGLSSRPPDPHGATRVVPGSKADTVAPSTEIPDLEAAIQNRAPQRDSGRSSGLSAPSRIEIGGFDELDQLELQRGGAPSVEPPALANAPVALELDELDVGSSSAGLSSSGLGSQARPRSRRPGAPIAQAHAVRVGGPSIAGRLRVPLGLVGLGSVVAGAGWVHQFVVGEPLLGETVRPLFIAGPLVVVGLILAVLRLFAASD